MFGANNGNIWWQSCFVIYKFMFQWPTEVLLHMMCFPMESVHFISFFQFLVPLWISWLICICNDNVVSLNAAYALCAHFEALLLCSI